MTIRRARRELIPLAIVLCLVAVNFKPALAQSCTATCVDAQPGWNSMLRRGDISARSLPIQWERDTLSTSYIVQYKEQQLTGSFNSSQSTMDVEYVIEGLMPETDYEVRVCRANGSSTDLDNCGYCLLCLTTVYAQEPPSAPLNLKVESVGGPRVLIITWAPPSTINGVISNYTVECRDSTSNSLDFITTGVTENFVQSSRLALDTMYTCSVYALNAFGRGPAAVKTASTRALSIDPGILLAGFDGHVDYDGLEEGFQAFLPSTEISLLIDTTSSSYTVIGIDYHFYRNEIYFSQTNRVISRLNVTFTVDSFGKPSFSYIAPSGDILIGPRPAEVTLGSLAVDWIRDDLYWVETEGVSTSRIMRSKVSGDGLYCVVQWSVDPVFHIAVDPIHGYFYWNRFQSPVGKLLRIPLDDIRTNSSSCMSSIANEESFLMEPSLTDFSLDSNSAIFYIGECNTTQIMGGRALKATSLNSVDTQCIAGINQIVVHGIDSFSDYVLVSFHNSDTLVNSVITYDYVGGSGNPIFYRSITETANVLRIYRESKQPLPAPPSPPINVRVSSTVTSLTISWERPQFVGNFFSSSAYSDWEYIVTYSLLGESSLNYTTRATSYELTDLQSGSLYEFTVSAQGLDPNVTLVAPESGSFIFSTKSTDEELGGLIIASDAGIIRSDVSGANAMYIDTDPDDRFSREANGIAYYSLIGTYYWPRKGLTNIQRYNGSGSSEDLFNQQRDNPFSLRLDWVTQRLFWVEEGDKATSPIRIVSAPISGSEEPQSFLQSLSITTTALDSINGVLFWISGNNIMQKMLISETDLAQLTTVCYSSTATITTLTVDVRNRRLYWISSDGDSTLSVSQLGYTSLKCDTTPADRLIPDSLDSLSPTAMAYAAGTLFVSGGLTAKVYTLPANLSSVVAGTHTLAVGHLNYTNLAIVPTSIRDIAINSSSLQQLPGGLTANTPTLALTPPGPPSSKPELDNSLSNSSVIVIQWGPSVPLQFDSPVVYHLQYSLFRIDGTEIRDEVVTTEETQVVLTNQMPRTTVEATVTSLSYWAASTMPITATFKSPPAIPGQVANVRAYPFSPFRVSSEERSAIVVWDELSILEAGGQVEKYEVKLFEIVSVDSLTEITITQNEEVRRVASNAALYTVQHFPSPYQTSISFPLRAGKNYAVQVRASNSAGNGIYSQLYNFSTPNVPTPFGEIFTVTPSGGQRLSFPGDSVEGTLVNVASPLDVDAKNRRVFWYSTGLRVIYEQSLDIEDMNPKILIATPAEATILSLFYDWVGERLYYCGAVNSQFVLWSVLPMYTEGVEQIFVGSSLTATSQVTLVVDPFGGFAYWTVVDTSQQSLYQLDLRNVTNGAIQIISKSSNRRKRSITMDITPALALDPISGLLWVCDLSTGNILSCNASSMQCNVEVTMAPSVGLPTDSLALDEANVYWRGDNIVAYASRDPPSTPTMFSTASVSVVSSLSPGQEPLPPKSCLHPDTSSGTRRPMPILVEGPNNATLSSLYITWPNPDELTLAFTFPPAGCTYPVYSYSPLRFDVEVDVTNHGTVDGYPQSTYITKFNVTGLMSYVKHDISVRSENQYSTRLRNPDNGFGLCDKFTTLPGVPDRPFNLTATVFGTRHVRLRWRQPITGECLFNTLHGPKENLAFFVEVLGRERTPINVTGVIAGQCSESPVGLPTEEYDITDLPSNTSEHTVQVYVNNGLFVSDPSPINVTTWLLPPALRSINVTNNSLIAELQLSEAYFPIVEVFVEIVSSNDTSSKDTSVPQNVSITPSSDPLVFPFENLKAFDVYELTATATYEVASFLSNTTKPETLPGAVSTVKTLAGVPDKPTTLISATGELSWSVARIRGEGIREYILTAMRISNSVEMPLTKAIPSTSTASSFNLQDDNTFLDIEIAYSIEVIAVNEVGPSDPSEAVTFTRVGDTVTATVLPPAAIIGISVGGGVGILIVVAICVFMCVMCVSASNKRGEVQLSYAYGPDHELNDLRNNTRAQSENPHYLWSRDDYQCTDEQLEQLPKFPRQNLKLEFFLDRGQFGEVYQGTAIDILGPQTGPTPVAVKTLRKGAGTEEQRQFISEAALMGHFNHPNIVKVLGLCVDNDPIYIIMELMPAGDLLKFLRDAKRDHGPALLTLAEQMQIALDVGNGCRYLEQQHFIHRDIAARNCLVTSKGSDRVVKIGDFGLAKDLYSSDYYQVEGQRKLPVRWMAPEALLQGKFTMESDIWSYGVLLWEIMTLGNQPYPGLTNQEVLQFVTAGSRLDKPDRCPGRIYQLMQQCWKKYPSERPHFLQIVETQHKVLDHIKRDSIYNDSESDEDSDTMPRRGSSRRSIRSGFMNLARSGSMKLRNSLRRTGSIHRREEQNAQNHNSGDNEAFREAGPF